MSVKLVLKDGKRPLTQDLDIPSSWMSKDQLLHAKEYNISVRDLDNVKERLCQESYWHKNPKRDGFRLFNFEDRWNETEWVRYGMKKGKYGEYWNPIKLDILQDDLEENLLVPDTYLSMKQVKSLFGSWATKDKVKEAGYTILYGRKKGQPGCRGYFVSDKILKDSKSVSEDAGLIPVRQIFSSFPHISSGDIGDIVTQNKDTSGRMKKLRTANGSSRQDIMVSTDSLLALEDQGINPTKRLRSREITTVDVPETSAAVRKLLLNRQHLTG